MSRETDVAKSQKYISKMLENGWTFKYEPDTRFIGAEHPDGGKQTICEIRNVSDPRIFGEAIAGMLNGDKVKKITLKHYTNRFSQIGEILLNGEMIATINRFFKVTEESILIFDTKGGQGTGYSPGEIINKISLKDREFELQKVRT